MGIYPTTTYDRTSETLVVTTGTPGLIVTETFALVKREENRTDCFCCSCPDYHSDPSCRDHSWFGSRPCEEHNMPGQLDYDGNMPESVQKERERQQDKQRG